MMKKLLLFICICFSGLIATAQSGKGYEKAVIDFMEATNAKETTITGLVSMYQNMNLPISNMQGMCEEIVDIMWPKMIQGYSTIMQEYYSLDDLNTIVSFYKTPAGRKFAKYNPVVVQKAMEFSMTPEMVSLIEPIILKYAK